MSLSISVCEPFFFQPPLSQRTRLAISLLTIIDYIIAIRLEKTRQSGRLALGAPCRRVSCDAFGGSGGRVVWRENNLDSRALA